MQFKIFNSIRWRMQLWQGLLLLAVVSSFGSLFYYRTRQARLAEIDGELQAALMYLEVTLRSFPRKELEDGEDGMPPPPPTDRPDKKGFLPPDKGVLKKKGSLPPAEHREHLYGRLNLNDRFFRRPDAFFVIWRDRGDILKASRTEPSRTEPSLKMPILPDPITTGEHPTVFWQEGPNRKAATLGPAHTTIVVGTSIDHDLSELDRFAWHLVFLGGSILVLGLAGNFLISMRLMRPIAAMTATAENISASNLSHRINTTGIESELGNLASILNAMFARLESAFAQQARFAADASHELRTPLSVIHSQAELALLRPRPAEEYREALQTCLRASQRMKGTVEGLLLLARADAHKLTLQRRRVDLAALAEETLELLRPPAEENNIALRLAANKVEVTADGDQLGRVLMNLVSNAIQYNLPGGSVKVAVGREGSQALIAVADTGVGIPAEDQPYIFERFFRVDKARSRQIGGSSGSGSSGSGSGGSGSGGSGSGLGLSICRSIIEAHDGTLTFTSATNQGSTFVVRLPLPQEGIVKGRS